MSPGRSSKRQTQFIILRYLVFQLRNFSDDTRFIFEGENFIHYKKLLFPEAATNWIPRTTPRGAASLLAHSGATLSRITSSLLADSRHCWQQVRAEGDDISIAERSTSTRKSVWISARSENVPLAIVAFAFLVLHVLAGTLVHSALPDKPADQSKEAII